ncbi:hypothetical protein [Rhodococcus chondri]|uniref:ESX-1 secretion-associated protein EspA/EspE-like domain-containing protein n=1 Tax=Rhodococcus chondri TaxID=3065941 RepID=A0ABU7JMR4_9NOCA|nr:hypothetical protein [Rhodococcus sp. CC-R104]MEE2031328.1 hypothetical protein [Rhodococcus sp. CC-R104]
MTAPVHALDAPAGSDPIPDLLEEALGLYYISPSFYIQKFCTGVIGVDPWAMASEKCSGDWGAIARAGESVHNLAAFDRIYAAGIGAAAATSEPWTGTAADATRDYLARLQNAVDSRANQLDRIGTQLEQMAVAMYELGRAVGDTLAAITDSAIIAIIHIAAAKAALLTGVGVVASTAASGLAAVEIARILDAWSTITSVWTKTWTLVQALMSGLVGSLATMERIELPPLPTT